MSDPNAESILPESDAGAPAVAASSSPAAAAPAPSDLHVRCDFCESRVTRAKGEVLELGKRARKMRDNELKIEELERTISQLQSKVQELTPAAAPAAVRESLLDKKFW